MHAPAHKPIPQVSVFGRIPRLGAGKTRLARGIGAAHAAALAEAFLLDVLERALAVAPGATWFHVAPEPDRPAADTLAAAHRLVDARVHLALQEGAHLGARMEQALAALSARGPAVVVGADVPDLPATHLTEALAWLEGPADTPRLVLGPAGDGGFVLIGADRAPGAILRDEPEWGTGDVRERTRRLAAAAVPAWRVHELAPWWDVDEPGDLAALRERLRVGGRGRAPRTAALLARGSTHAGGSDIRRHRSGPRP